ncbi:MAG TPA: permease-like cell division protein FtsX [Bacteroidales bacterium]|nr:permease-like cell division protein FtsX [Bacteroidales bacterium]
MSGNPNKDSYRRLRSSYVTSTISLTLVLLLLGIVGLLILNAKKLSDVVKENINFTIVLKPNVEEADILKLQKQIDLLQYVKSTRYLTKEKAAEEFSKDLGEDFVSFLGFNPLLSSIEVKMHAQYANEQYVKLFENKLKSYPVVREVIYEKSLIHLVNENVRKISLVILTFSALLFLIAVALINNTVRLLVHSRRFTIRTMQLVGATKSFIRKPFLFKSMVLGFMASTISIVAISGILIYTERNFSDMSLLVDFRLLYYLFGGLIVLGIMINLISTFFALNKYLNIQKNNLY